ncbi:MAG: aldehyde dehydrogenase family protein, partial [Cocleimonas sp.]
MIERKQFYIDGQWVDPIKENPFEVINPATEEVAGMISMGTKQDVDKAVAAAVKAFPSWSTSS